MAGTIVPEINTSGSRFSPRACFVIATAVLASPWSTASWSFCRSAMGYPFFSPWRLGSRPAAEFTDGVDHRHDVLDGRAGLDVVDRVEHETAPRREDLAPTKHLL